HRAARLPPAAGGQARSSRHDGTRRAEALMSQPAGPLFCRAIVEKQIETQPGFFRLLCRVPKAFPDPKPGQFVHLKLSERTDPLLPRPYGVVDFRREADHSIFELYYGVVGAASR